MKKISYALILFIGLFVFTSVVNAEYKLEEGEEVLLKCDYGNSADKILFSVLKTNNNRFIVDNVYYEFCNEIVVDIDRWFIQQGNGEKIEQFKTPPSSTRPEAVKNYCGSIIYVRDEGGVCYFKNAYPSDNPVGYWDVGVQSGEVGELVKEEESEYPELACSYEVNLGYGQPFQLILSKKYNQYYYKYIGYEFNSGNNVLANENKYNLSYHGTDLTLIIDSQTSAKFKEHLQENTCPTKEEFRMCATDFGLDYSSDKEIITFTQSSYCPTIYSNHLEALKTPLSFISSDALNYTLVLNNEDITLNDLDASESFCKIDDCPDARKKTEEALFEIRTYCNDVYNAYVKSKNSGLVSKKNECMVFNEFYNWLVKENIISDLSSGCDFVTDDLRDKLIWILDLIKIAGPILALGLGTLDFVKVLAAGDADKEMKNAFKRFSIRILAAILLFIIPVILAFLLDVFIGNQDGYNSDNPFCSVVEWEV